MAQGVSYRVCGAAVWCRLCGAWYRVWGVGCVVHGAASRCVTHGVWCRVYGAVCVVYVLCCRIVFKGLNFYQNYFQFKKIKPIIFSWNIISHFFVIRDIKLLHKNGALNILQDIGHYLIFT